MCHSGNDREPLEGEIPVLEMKDRISNISKRCILLRLRKELQLEHVAMPIWGIYG